MRLDSGTNVGRRPRRGPLASRSHPGIPTVLAALCVASMLLAPAAVAQQLTDQQIADAVEDEILLDPMVSVNDVDVRVVGDVVTLSGTVDNLLAKERAARIAQTVRGVASVVNDLEVEPYWGRMDWEIEQDAEAALRANPATDTWGLDVAVEDNSAILTGTVDSWQEAQLAEKVVRSTRGVTSVDNQVAVMFEDDRLDSEIEAEVEEALRWDVLVDAALVDVDVRDATVTLTGVVGSAAEKQRARLDAWVAGVEDVDATGLDVERWARDPDLRRDDPADLSDTDIEQAVHRALVYDPRVLSTDIGVKVENGVATLRGEVDSLAAKRAAAMDARNTVGVDAVVNRVKVRPMSPSDEEVEQNLENALLRDPYLERYDISVSVVDGTAYLAGSVDSYYEKGEAEEIAAETHGVTDVRNNLVVEYDRTPLAYDPYVYDWYPYDYGWYDYEPYATYRSDAEIREEINDELWWSPFVDSDDVKVQVEDGVATLSGVVEDYGELDAAIENAYEGGAVWVDNDLTIE